MTEQQVRRESTESRLSYRWGDLHRTTLTGLINQRLSAPHYTDKAVPVSHPQMRRAEGAIGAAPAERAAADWLRLIGSNVA